MRLKLAMEDCSFADEFKMAIRGWMISATIANVVKALMGVRSPGEGDQKKPAPMATIGVKTYAAAA